MKTLVNMVAVSAMLLVGFAGLFYAPEAQARRITCEQAWIKQLNQDCIKQVERAERRLPRAITDYKAQEALVQAAEQVLANIVEKETYLRALQEENIRELTRSEQRYLDRASKEKERAEKNIQSAKTRLAREENEVVELVMQIEAAGFKADGWRNRFRDAQRSAKRILR